MCQILQEALKYFFCSFAPNNKDNGKYLFKEIIYSHSVFPRMVQPQFRAHTVHHQSEQSALSFTPDTPPARSEGSALQGSQAVQEQSVAAATNTSCDLTGLRARGSASRASLSPAPSAHPSAVSSD